MNASADALLVVPIVSRWGYKLNGRDFVAYQQTREGAAELFAKVLEVPVEHVEPIIVELAAENQVGPVVDERKAPGS